MLAELHELDPPAAARLHENDSHRIVRALEAVHTGVPLTAQAAASRDIPSPYRACVLVLDVRNRANLYARIDARVDVMLANGLLDEARRVLAACEPAAEEPAVAAVCAAATEAPFAAPSPGVYAAGDRITGVLQAIGYKEFAPYFHGDISLDEAAARLKQQTRRYAKRQLTWFRHTADRISAPVEPPASDAPEIHRLYIDEDDILSRALEVITHAQMA
ncbi:MAG: tRNA dimethylallyltransferase [Oscillospiraceae bacterium]|nr:tRNA dimethylallyltransferase [Oscillospiraceae bacterium]